MGMREVSADDKGVTQFIAINAQSKTLRNELIPTYTTKLHIQEQGFITDDMYKAEKRKVAKEMMDEYYRNFVDEKLQLITDIDWHGLFDLMRKTAAGGDKNIQKQLRSSQEKIRKEICKAFSNDIRYKHMFGEKMITKLLPQYLKEKNEEDVNEKMEILKVFFGFSTYFTDFFNTRKNVFSDKEISSAIGYRIVNDNAYIFMGNISSFQHIKKDASSEIEKIEEESEKYLNGCRLEALFDDVYYGNVLRQTDIDTYNNICAVINSHMNLYCQRMKTSRSKYRMQKLHKQILSVAVSGFTIPEKFQTDDDVFEALNAFTGFVIENRIMERLRAIGKNTAEYDTNRIYVDAKAFGNVSMYMNHSWNIIETAMHTYFSNVIRGKEEVKEKKIKTKMDEIKFCSLGDLHKLINLYYKTENTSPEHEAEEYIEKILTIVKDLETRMYYPGENSIVQDDAKAAEIKNYMDKYLEIYHWLQCFIVDESLDKDRAFYSDVEDIYEQMAGVILLYNKIRNYVTQKPYSDIKIKLNFGTPTLADGWSKSKEYSNNVIVLLRDNRYYLAVFNPKNKPPKDIISGSERQILSTDYKKMNYYLLPGASKTLPHVFIASNKWKDSHGIPDEILAGYKANKHLKTSDSFDLAFCRKLIDYYKECINCYPNYQCFNFKFEETDTYNDISEFYKDVENQGYKIEWSYISEKNIEKLDQDGQIYMFQIYNKDFAEGSRGTDNLHTMYLKNIFSEENLRDIVIKLNGEAELFFREASVTNPIEHKKGSVLVNKTYENNGVMESVPDDVYLELVDYWKNNGKTKISAEAQKYVDKVSHFDATMDITKDRRYTVDKYFIHLPITINYKAKDRLNLNDQVLKYISQSDDLHIIGIDRGERNLLYVSVVDCNGRIVEQKSFNIVETYDSANGKTRRHNYKGKLVNKENYRTSARKNWKEIGKIKEIKEGYLSQVVHEITQMVLKYNAIIVMEDLNYGFKRGRFKVERQVYQKFESMLITKLAYLVDKQRKVDEPGGLLRGYQLAYIPDNWQKIGKQCGIVFYVPAAYTSRIDPTTGFVDIFNFKDITNMKARLEFINCFDSIRYDTEKELFVMDFDYKNFKTHNTTLANSEWSIYAHGERIRKYKNFETGKWMTEIVDVEKEFKALFDNVHICYEDGHNLLDDINQLENSIQNDFTRKLIEMIRLGVQLRNSKLESEDKDGEYDRIISPVLNADGRFFDSKNYILDDSSELPKDADANGAYCIALKGLYNVKIVRDHWNDDDKFDRKLLSLSNSKWFDFIQNKRFK